MMLRGLSDAPATDSLEIVAANNVSGRRSRHR